MISSLSSSAGVAQAAPREHRITGSTRNPDSFDFLSGIAAARAESAAAAQDKADMQARNASAILHFAQQGMTMTLHSFAGDYKDQLAVTVDSDGSKDVSVDELTRQVMQGGGSAQQAQALYAAMDANSDGKLSLQEFKDNIADPFQSAEFRAKLTGALSAEGAGHGGAPVDVLALYREQGERMDAPTVLGSMAKNISVTA